MKNIYSNIKKVNNKNINIAIKYLKSNHPIGVPTETVYGLAANAYSKEAVNRIFLLKKRPKFNPLIIHYSNIKALSKDAELNKNFFKLYKKFCPGPITFVLKKKKSSKVSSLATANLNTIAVRFPSNKIIKNILKRLKFPLAIPSANKSGGISPVKAQDVFEEFGNKIKIIISSGNCKIGIESTVVDLTSKVKILRPGFIDNLKISRVIRSKIFYTKDSKKIKSPGLLRKHYSPGIPIKLNQRKCEKNDAFIIFGRKYKDKKNTFNLSKRGNLNEAAKSLYKIFRKIKNKGFKKISVVKITKNGIGFAINDRLRRAAAK
jgi:L-threonylcarbamoyladenylate synthase